MIQLKKLVSVLCSTGAIAPALASLALAFADQQAAVQLLSPSQFAPSTIALSPLLQLRIREARLLAYLATPCARGHRV